MTLLLVWLLMQAGVPQQPVGTGVIAGSVMAFDTGKPIKGAVIDLVSFDGGTPFQRRVATDVEGKFQFPDLPAHTYQLTVSADKFLRMAFGQQQPGPTGLNNPTRPINLREGEQFRAADFKMWRQSALEGVVTDEFGDPVPNVAIQLSQLQFAGGRRRLYPMAGSGPGTATDDKGQFRIIGLAPGDYYVAALSGAFADPSAAGGFAVTYYPNATSPGRAQPVTIAPGKDAKVAVALVPAAMRRVAGRLVDGDGQPIGRSDLMIMPSESSGTASLTIARLATDADGRFVFRNLPTGTFTIQAYGRQVPGGGGNLGSFAFGWLTFTVGDRDIDDLTVVVPAPRSIRGRITFDGDATPQPRPGEVRIFPAPMDYESAPVGGGPPPFKVNADWTFEVNAMSGLRAVQVSAGAWVVERITRGGQDVTDAALDLREKDVNDLEIVLTTRTTTVTGAVTLADGSPAKDYNVVIYADDESKWKLWSRYVVLARPNQQGTFSVKGLPAGVYLAVVAPTMANGQWQDPDFLAGMRVQATRFTIGDGETRALQLKMKTP